MSILKFFLFTDSIFLLVNINIFLITKNNTSNLIKIFMVPIPLSSQRPIQAPVSHPPGSLFLPFSPPGCRVRRVWPQDDKREIYSQKECHLWPSLTSLAGHWECHKNPMPTHSHDTGTHFLLKENQVLLLEMGSFPLIWRDGVLGSISSFLINSLD